MLAGEARAELDVTSSYSTSSLESIVLVVVVKLSEFVSSRQEVGDMQPSPESQQLSLSYCYHLSEYTPNFVFHLFRSRSDTTMNTMRSSPHPCVMVMMCCSLCSSRHARHASGSTPVDSSAISYHRARHYNLIYLAINVHIF